MLLGSVPWQIVFSDFQSIVRRLAFMFIGSVLLNVTISKSFSIFGMVEA